MKINKLASLLPNVFRVQDRAQSEKGFHEESSGQNPDPSKSDDLPVDPNELEEAIRQFGNDEQARAKGLKAEIEKSIPGLKVVLRDSKGAILRHLSGSEFLRLTEATAGLRRSGKLLDKKL